MTPSSHLGSGMPKEKVKGSCPPTRFPCRAPLFLVGNRLTDEGREGDLLQSGVIACTVDSLPLMPRTYLLDLYFDDVADITRHQDVIRDAISVEAPADVFGTGLPPPTCFRTHMRARSNVSPLRPVVKKLNESEERGSTLP